MRSPMVCWRATWCLRDNGSIGSKGQSDLTNMIQLTEAGKRFGPKILIQGLNWLITPKERVGIVGGNGTGKSTLLKALAGIESLDYGSLNVMKGIRAGYLPQDGITLTGRSVFNECLSVFDEIRD